jgi:phosphatidylglycerol lysyltransferase
MKPRQFPAAALLLAALALVQLPPAGLAAESPGRDLTVPLTRGAFTLHAFAPVQAAKRLIVFGTGDGGWSPWEQKVCAALAQAGNYVLGLDFRAYARTDYTLDTLRQDAATLVAAGLKEAGNAQLPVILGGWSMGAAQSVPMAAAPGLTPRVAGLLLVAPSERGRYGLRAADELGFLPKGEGTFALSDFGAALKNIPIAQYHAEKDFLDAPGWLGAHPGPHKLVSEPEVWHDFGGANDAFIGKLKQGLAWLDQPGSGS